MTVVAPFLRLRYNSLMHRNHPWVVRWREASKNLKLKIVALYFATRDDATPWQAKGLALLVVIYALSPIDLIPDFLPTLGYVDDLIIVTLGIWYAIRLIPAAIMAEAFRKAAAIPNIDRKLGQAGTVILVGFYVLITWWVWRYLLAAPE